MRILKELKTGWLFSKQCKAAPVQLPSGEDWENVSLPHTWNAVDGQIGIPFDRGAYWYVTCFEVQEQPVPGGRTYVDVGAASLVGEIWVNGVFIMRHVGGFSAFRADVTDACHSGMNVLAIMCDNSYSEKVYPQRADFTFYGGLYRYVRIVSVPASRFSMDFYGSSGIFIDPQVENGCADIKVRAMVSNPQDIQKVSVEILDAQKNVVSEAWAKAGEMTQLRLLVPNPELWDGRKKGYVYTARVRLVESNEVIDEVSETFGMRTFRVDADEGFFLNNRSYPLRGVCRHQDRLYQGNALDRNEHFEDARIISEMGANCVRLAHYQQSHDIYDACDQLGLVVWAEIPYFARTWNDEAHASALIEIREMCAQNYNHPSICFWGLSNEILIGGNDDPKLIPCHIDLEKAVKEIDTTRITVIAHEYEADWNHPLHDISEAEGWNHYFGWYRGATEDLGKWLDAYHTRFPERKISVSEYGCDTVIGFHSQNPAKMDYSEEYQAELHESALRDFAERPFVWGTFVWNMFDFGSSIRKEGGTKGRNNKGLVTMDRKIRKDSFYVYKAWLSDEPFVHIDGRRFFHRPGSSTTVTVHANVSSVRLLVDGKPFDNQEGTHKFVFENVPISESGTFITAVSGSCTDTVTLYGGAEDKNEFVFPGFIRTMDAANWFEDLKDEETLLPDVAGHYSVHDTLGEILKSREAVRVVADCLIAATQRLFPEEMLQTLDAEQSVFDTFSTGMFGIMLGTKKDSALRKMQSALLWIPKSI